MTKVFYVAISNDETVNGSIVIPDSMVQVAADIEQRIVWDIEDTHEDWYDLYIEQLTSLHVIICGTNPEGYMVELNGTRFASNGDIIFNYIDIDDNNEIIRYCI